ncbi:MAG TPA: hypothetical protein VGC97_08720 [Pyrinomonadaceae bacterium]
MSDASESEITPEEDKLNRQAVVDLIMPVVEKIQKLPLVPVAESFDELLSQLKNPQRCASVVAQTYDGKRIEVSNGITKIISDGSELPAEATKTNSSELPAEVTNFNKDELLILERIKNGKN